ncbi:MAG: 3-hydroxyacyl-CoA dehydrogenase/enoyl-CoA hydratase family protein [Alphaproteobacteria bacterium]|nr:3-hydroxyacyl-CoA dehydrogenase/enoyl-CoA hydratase family protein [Alphaproteobacteria bacterium]NCQ88386.1 3-hydroxyacyl-CoA dehydrogenase/enoyl-CoA hydratase family protein [Alphaproteobacteria bacterium]NCT05928.1 3-hydroxyacyl-CoA dehydrogenase/enoyl-CoA hydratase family protein [Alphaproteobacteria bacterium]
MTINKVAVIGAGLMGSGIAAQIANAGIPVVLLDIVPKDASDRNVIAKGAIAKMLKADPAPFMSSQNAKLIEVGNLEDDLDKISDCDWIIEVVLEDLKIKHATYEKIQKHRKKGSIVTSNTSTIPLAKLVEGQPDAFVKDFMITHFFNPPRYMRLLEIVTSDKTNKDAVKTVQDFCDIQLGKGVVHCKDTPGFIVNRLLVFWMQTALNVAVADNVPLEVADSVMGKPIGVPKTAVFGLIDLVGVDLMPYLASSMLSSLPKDDEYRKIYKDYGFVKEMIAAGYNGRKGKGGFYRLNPDPAAGKEKQTLDLNPDKFDEGQYRASDKPHLESMSAGKKGLRAVVEAQDQGGHYAWKVLSQTLCYAASLVPQIADDIASVDEAMRFGTNWKNGPFQMIDQLGPKWFADKLREEGISVPTLLDAVGEGSFYRTHEGKLQAFGTDGKYHDVKRSEGVLLLSDIKLSNEPVIKTASASVWNIGDGVLCVEFTGKMNALDEPVFDAYYQAIKLIGDGSGDYKAMVIYNEGSHFSAGANLGLAIFAMNIAMWPQIEALVSGGQKVYKALKYAPFPVVSAPSGMALGGGCEILLHSDHVQAHAETYTGLVEVGVGLIPGWGGCKEMVLRYQAAEQNNYDKSVAVTGQKKLWFSPKNTPMGAVRKAFELIAMATVAKSAQEAKEYKYLKETDGITMNRDRLLYDAKQKALELAKDYKAPEPVDTIRLPGPSGRLALELAVSDLRKSGKATPYDVPVSMAVANVLTGGEKADWTTPLHEDDIYKLEREEFMKLVKNEGTQMRVEHMLEKGKPLRN